MSNKPNPRRYLGKRKPATYAWSATCDGSPHGGEGRTRSRGVDTYRDLRTSLKEKYCSVQITSLTRIRG